VGAAATADVCGSAVAGVPAAASVAGAGAADGAGVAGAAASGVTVTVCVTVTGAGSGGAGGMGSADALAPAKPTTAADTAATPPITTRQLRAYLFIVVCSLLARLGRRLGCSAHFRT
jgi:hypothetical protein